MQKKLANESWLFYAKKCLWAAPGQIFAVIVLGCVAAAAFAAHRDILFP